MVVVRRAWCGEEIDGKGMMRGERYGGWSSLKDAVLIGVRAFACTG